MKTVLVFGTFDGLHPGHLHFLREAKKRGDSLAVVVARDSTATEVKGRRPLNDERQRLESVRALGFVDEAMLGGEGNKFDVIRKIKPDVICLGYDQSHFTGGLEKKLGEMGIRCRVVRIGAHRPHMFKSSLLRMRAVKA